MKAKKILAVLMTAAVLMGTTAATTVNTFAAVDQVNLTSTITVTGLTQNETATLHVYAAVTLDAERNNWVVAEWAKQYIVLNDAKTAYTITDAEELGKAAQGQEATYERQNVTTTSYEFTEVPIGAYVILAAGSNAETGTSTEYSTMVANTYDNTGTYIQVKDKKVVAKSSTVTLTKKEKLGDKFVGRGETVEFTVTTTFPNFADDVADRSFVIWDEPTGLDITEVKGITVGGAPLGTDLYTTSEDPNTGKYTIDLSNSIGTINENAGKTVVVTYEAIVTTDEGYTNTANSSNSGASSTIIGFTGDLTVTKVAYDGDEDPENNTRLAGAKFKVYAETAEGEREVLKLVQKKDADGNLIAGEYMLAKADEVEAVEEIEVADSGEKIGIVKVSGLGGGTYFFEETVAPDGYSINGEGVTFTITEENAENHISLEDDLVDTKLSSLPSTGGIGTTIFTVAGCLIMVAAAGMFFVSRRKESK